MPRFLLRQTATGFEIVQAGPNKESRSISTVLASTTSITKARRHIAALYARQRRARARQDSRTLDRIQELMSGQEWDSETLTQVAEFVQATGRIIEDYDAEDLYIATEEGASPNV